MPRNVEIGGSTAFQSLFAFSRVISGLLDTLLSKYIQLTVFAALAAAAEAILHPLLMRAIFNHVTEGAPFADLVVLGVGYLLLGLTLNFVGYKLGLAKIAHDNKIVAQVTARALSSFYTHDYKEIQERGDGYFMARIRSDVKDGLAPMLASVRRCVVSIVTFCALVSVLLVISWQVFAILCGIIPVATIVSRRISARIRALTVSERDQEAALMSTLTKAIHAFKMVRGFGLREATVQAVTCSHTELLDAAFKKQHAISKLQSGSDLTMVLSDACSIFVGSAFVLTKQLSLGSFIAFMNAFWRSATSLIDVFKQMTELQGHAATILRLHEFMQEDSEGRAPEESDKLDVRGVSVSFGASSALSPLTVQVSPGSRVLLTGPNGSGKTTFANVLAGLIDPSSGTLRRPASVSAITLPLAFPPLRVEELPIDVELLDRLHVGHDANAWPDQLSAGQQQKIALGLALSKPAALYVLDEPLANLDASSRRVAVAAIEERTAGRMLVMSMHGDDEYRFLFDRTIELKRSSEGGSTVPAPAGFAAA
jgi:ABC-type multidrug transport system fused ATPase/permease subunit